MQSDDDAEESEEDASISMPRNRIYHNEREQAEARANRLAGIIAEDICLADYVAYTVDYTEETPADTSGSHSGLAVLLV